jgi:hypothetical protein
VIDTTLSTATIFLTSNCHDSFPHAHWYLHALKLVNGQDVNSPIDIQSPSGSPITFSALAQMQRPALLEVPVQSSASLIYIAFGVANKENDVLLAKNQYNGWMFAYDTSLNRKFGFVTVVPGSESGWLQALDLRRSSGAFALAVLRTRVWVAGLLLAGCNSSGVFTAYAVPGE